MNSVTEPCITRVLLAAFLSCRGVFFSFSWRPQLINGNNYKKIILHLQYCNLHLNPHQYSVNVLKYRKKAEEFLEPPQEGTLLNFCLSDSLGNDAKNLTVL